MARAQSLLRWLCPMLLLMLVPLGTAPRSTLSCCPTGGDLAWPQVPAIASYRIAVTLNPTAHTLAGREVITYSNRTADAIPNVAFHLYLNAFSSDSTLFMRESGGSSRGFGYNPAYPGWIKVDAIAGQGLDLLPATVVSETLMTTTLPQPLRAGQVLTLTVDFHALLPQVFARSGFSGDFHMVGQWFPKLGVYQEGKGWNAYPYHANSEFFADFGTYDVAITVPSAYVVAGSGLLAGREDHPDSTSTHRFHAEAVIDFAWAAAPTFQQAQRQVGPTEVVLFYLPEHESIAQRYLATAEQALTRYGDWYGPYPYPRLTLVDVPDHAQGAGGMEYPTLVTVGFLPLPSFGQALFPEMVAAHEIAHQWWQSVVATNEFEDPWLDEGFAEYSGSRLLEQTLGPGSPLFGLGTVHIDSLDLDRLQYLLDPAVPMYGRAWDFSSLEYDVAAYYKPAMALATLERTLGEERWLAVLRAYYQHYQFRHPTTADFLAVVAEVAGEDVRRQLDPLVFGRGLVDYAVTDLECAPTGQLHHCEATVARLGEIALPVEVEITFADGRRGRESWDGQDVTKRYVYNERAPVESVQVDPGRKLYLDIDWVNNSLTRHVQAGALLRISSPWFFILEQLILILGGIW